MYIRVRKVVYAFFLVLIAFVFTGCKKTEYEVKIYTSDTNYYTITAPSDRPLMITAPTKEGYEFIGWFKDQEITERFEDEIYPTKNLVIYAGWQVKKFMITFETNGGTTLENQEFAYEQEISNLPIPTKEDYRFGGWYLDSDFKTPFNLQKMPAHDLTLYVKWILDTEKGVEHTITYILNGGTLENKKDKFTKDDLPYVLPIPSKTGYEFEGWYLDSNFSVKITNINSLEDFTLYAKWGVPTEEEYKITYVLDGGTLTEEINIFTANDLPLTLPIPIKGGYEFLGWYTDASFTHKITQITSQDNVIVYARWQEITVVYYSINYHLDGGELLDSLHKFTASDLPYIIPIPIKAGFKFLGWYLDDSFTTKTELLTEARNYDLYAKWEEIIEPNIEYTITYHLDGGSLVDAKTKFTDKDLPLTLPTPTKEGCDFIGWYLEKEFLNKIETLEEAKDYALYAQFKEIKVPDENKIIYHLNGGTWGFNSKEELATSFLSDYYNFLMTTDQKPTVDLATFLHGAGQVSGFKGSWAVDLGSEGVSIPYLYQINNFDVDPSSEYFINQPEYNAKWIEFFEMMEVFTKSINEGQSFKNSVFTGNRRLYQYIRNEKPLPTTPDEVMNMLPAITKTVDQYRSSLEVILAKPIRNGYQFGGWYQSVDFSGEPIVKIPANSSGTFTLYAKWVQNGEQEEYSITYNLNGGTITGHKVKFTASDLPYVLVAPKREGYDFDGWFLDSTFNVQILSITKLENITVYAKWVESTKPIEKTYQITYNLNGGKWGFENKKSLIDAFLTDFHRYLLSTNKAPTNNLQEFMHGAGKTSGYAGSWVDVASANLYLANERSEDPTKPYFINQPEYNAKWIDFFDMMEEFTKKVNETQSFWGSTWTGNIRLRQYIQDVRPNGKETAEDMQMLPTFTKTVTKYRNTHELYLPKPIRSGYTFLGWYESADFSGSAVEKIPIGSSGNKTYYAKWNMVTQTYTITYHLNGGTNSSSNPTYYESNHNGVTLSTPARNGFRFDGWYLDSKFTGNAITSIPKSTTGNINLYAKWTELEITENTHMFIDRATTMRPHRLNNLQLSNGKIILKSGATSGTYESPVINTKGFKTLVGSWSAVTTSTNSVELQIRIKVGSSWSGWLSYGAWGLGRQNSSQSSTSGVGKINIDEISVTGSTSATAMQYKVTLRRDSSNNPSPQLSLVAMTLEIPNHTPSINMSGVPDSFGYTVPKLNQNVVPSIGSLICSPTSVTMLLKYRGKDFKSYDTYEHRYIAGLAKDHKANIYGNWSFNTALISAYGFNAYVKRMTSFNELKHHLHYVGPVAVSVKGNMNGLYTTNGHLLVVKGVVVKNGTTYVRTNDPNLSNVEYEYPLSVFNNVWRNIVYVIEK